MKVKRLGIALAVSAVLFAAGCGNSAQQGAPNQAVAVNAYKVSTENVMVSSTFTGSIVAKNETALKARVSGHVVERYVNGGERVEAGQALFKLDSRQYAANLAAAQSNAAQSSSAYQNAQVDLQRYEMLAKEDAIARQTLDTQRAVANQQRAAYEATQAQVQIAQDNMNDTVVYAPFSGTLNMDIANLGDFVTAGATTLATLSSTDPVYVEFSLSENEYLDFMKKSTSVEKQENLQLRLSDGSIYEQLGKIVQVSKALEGNSGKIIVKAEFANPNKFLLPGMYATIVSSGERLENAILVPSKAVLQVLDKNFILVVGDDGVIKQVPVILGATQGKYVVVKEGLKAGEEIVVDGLTKVRAGSKVKATLLTKEQIAGQKQ